MVITAAGVSLVDDRESLEAGIDALRRRRGCELIGEALWPTEKLSAAEVTRRLALAQLLWAESEQGMVESVRTSA